MSLAVLGGCFDPPHVGHLWVVKQVLEFCPDIDRLLLMPAAKHQWKPIIASVTDRMQMLQAFTTEKKVIISDLELKRGGVSYSVETIKELKHETKDNIYWIVGSDILSEFSRWEKTETLTELATFLVFPRDPFSLPAKLPSGFEAIRDKELITTNLSSTLIRQRIKQGKSISGFVPEKVEEYIKGKGLYRQMT
ncbi:MAG: nicotinate (nicotinamide) nucleotide adenylyltransferase [Candidatus Levybacteria bacterium]|nr:nicotinate (nicotinamide) nucleotide adenylyltransferase [Candidatus Levybacteria bacterium]